MRVTSVSVDVDDGDDDDDDDIDVASSDGSDGENSMPINADRPNTNTPLVAGTVNLNAGATGPLTGSGPTRVFVAERDVGPGFQARLAALSGRPPATDSEVGSPGPRPDSEQASWFTPRRSHAH